MKSLIITLLFASFELSTMASSTTINAVLGDQSFIEKYGFNPDISTDDNLRIRVHLEYVENRLREVSTDHLSSHARKNREELLDVLHHYWNASTFPKPSVVYEGRKPCFIDYEGNICAVGYLIEMKSGRHITEQINKSHKFEYLLNMDNPIIDIWAKENGFSLKELAMIQPTYDGWPIQRVDLTIPEPLPIVTALVPAGPSKNEIALGVELDSLRQIHDSIVIALDSTLNVTYSQNDELSELQKEHDQSVVSSNKLASKSKDKISTQKWINYCLSGGLLALLGFTLFRQFNIGRKN
ncbi:MAG: hypothetical protein HRT57_14315 [Crocinitomicaceae bacterium]|nr:hypothetical protein [Crocinitomicaceae bacterium]